MRMRRTFPKSVKLHHSRTIRNLFEKGVYQSLGPIGVKYKMAETESSRFAVSVQKNVGSAPCRNRIKRLLREAIRQERSLLNYAYDICFFVASPPKRPLDSSYVLRQVRRFFNNVNKETSERACRHNANSGSTNIKYLLQDPSG